MIFLSGTPEHGDTDETRETRCKIDKTILRGLNVSIKYVMSRSAIKFLLFQSTYCSSYYTKNVVYTN